MGNLLGRGCALLLASVLLIGSAIAETIPATPASSTGGAVEKLYQRPGFSQMTTDYESLCVAHAAGMTPPGTYTHWVDSQSQCWGNNQYGNGVLVTLNVFYRCVDSPDTIGVSPSMTCPKAASCPSGQNWTLDGSTCTRPDCAAGEDRNAQGVCVKDCTAKQGMSLPNTHYETDTNGKGAFGGCRIACETSNKLGINASGTNSNQDPTYTGFYHISSSCRYTGASAQEGDYNSNGTGDSPKTNDPKKPDDCMGSGMGYITSSTGKTTCVPAGSAPEGQKPTKTTENKTKESGTPGADGKPDPTSGDYKKESTTTSSEGGKTTSTTTTSVNPTTDGNGNQTCPAGYTLNGSTCDKKTTTTQSTGDYCATNPTASACKGSEANNTKSTFGGSCEAGFQCDGDAATCAIARASWETNCAIKEKPNGADFGQDLIDGNDGVQLPNKDNPEVIEMNSLGYTDIQGVCLPDFQFTIMGRTSVVPTSGICTVAGWLGNLGVALSLLMAGYFIVGGLKG